MRMCKGILKNLQTDCDISLASLAEDGERDVFKACVMKAGFCGSRGWGTEDNAKGGVAGHGYLPVVVVVIHRIQHEGLARYRPG